MDVCVCVRLSVCLCACVCVGGGGLKMILQQPRSGMFVSLTAEVVCTCCLLFSGAVLPHQMHSVCFPGSLLSKCPRELRTSHDDFSG